MSSRTARFSLLKNEASCALACLRRRSPTLKIRTVSPRQERKRSSFFEMKLLPRAGNPTMMNTVIPRCRVNRRRCKSTGEGGTVTGEGVIISPMCRRLSRGTFDEFSCTTDVTETNLVSAPPPQVHIIAARGCPKRRVADTNATTASSQNHAFRRPLAR